MQNPEHQPDLDTARLDAFLRREIAGLEGEMTMAKIPGGQSNPTFFVSYDNRRLVLRKRLGEPWIIATVPGVGYRIGTQPGSERQDGEHG